MDLAVYLMLFGQLSARLWEAIGYFGEGRLSAELIVSGLTLSRGSDGTFTRAFDPRYQAVSGFKPPKVFAEAVVLSPSPRPSAFAEIGANYFSLSKDIVRSNTLMLNSLLRGLGHAVIWEQLENDIRTLQSKADQEPESTPTEASQ